MLRRITKEEYEEQSKECTEKELGLLDSLLSTLQFKSNPSKKFVDPLSEESEGEEREKGEGGDEEEYVQRYFDHLQPATPLRPLHSFLALTSLAFLLSLALSLSMGWEERGVDAKAFADPAHPGQFNVAVSPDHGLKLYALGNSHFDVYPGPCQSVTPDSAKTLSSSLKFIDILSFFTYPFWFSTNTHYYFPHWDDHQSRTVCVVAKEGTQTADLSLGLFHFPSWYLLAVIASVAILAYEIYFWFPTICLAADRVVDWFHFKPLKYPPRQPETDGGYYVPHPMMPVFADFVDSVITLPYLLLATSIPVKALLEEYYPGHVASVSAIYDFVALVATYLTPFMLIQLIMIFFGQTIGRALFGLVLVDSKTGQKSSTQTHVLRDLVGKLLAPVQLAVQICTLGMTNFTVQDQILGSRVMAKGRLGRAARVASTLAYVVQCAKYAHLVGLLLYYRSDFLYGLLVHHV